MLRQAQEQIFMGDAPTVDQAVLDRLEKWVAFLAMAVIALGLMGIVGTLLNIPWLTALGVSLQVPMRLPTAVALVSMGLVLIWSFGKASPSRKEYAVLGVAGAITGYFLAISLWVAKFDIFGLISADYGISIPFLVIFNLFLCVTALFLFLTRKASENAMAYGVGVLSLFTFNLCMFAIAGHWLNTPALYDFRMSFPTALACALIAISLLIRTLPYHGLLRPLISKSRKIRILSVLALLLGTGILIDGVWDVQRLQTVVMQPNPSLIGLEHVVLGFELTSLTLAILVKTLSLRAIYFWEQSNFRLRQEMLGLEREAAVRRMITIVHSTLDLEEVFQRIVDEVGALLSPDRAYIAHYDQSENHLAPPTREFRSSEAVPSMIGADHRIAPEDGWLVQEICHAKDPFLFDQRTPRLSEATRDYFREIQLVSGLGCSIHYQQQCLAILFIHQTTPRQWTQAERHLVQTAASQLAVAIHQSQLYQQVSLGNDYQAALAHFSQTVMKEVDFNNIFQQAVELVAGTLHVKFCHILEHLPQEGGRLVFRAMQGWPSRLLGRKLMPEEESHAAYTLSVAHPVLVRNFETETRFAPGALHREFGLKSGISVVVRQNHAAYGVLEANADEERIFTPNEEEFMQTLANMLAIAIERKRSEQSLLESNERYQLVNRATNDLIWDWDLLTNRMKVNDAIQRVYGYPLEEVREEITWWNDRIHPEDFEGLAQSIREAIASGNECWSREYRILCGNGGFKNVLDRGFILREESGRAIRMIGTMIDISERIQWEQVLRESEARFRNLAETAPVMIWLADAHANVTYANKYLRDFFVGEQGVYEPSEWESRGYIHPDDLPYTRQVYYGAFDSKKPYTFEARHRRWDGEYRWFLSTGNPRFSENGEFLGYIGSSVDITERKGAEVMTQARLEREELLRKIMENINSSYNIDHILHNVAREVAEYFDADRCLLAHTGEDDKEAISFYEQYCRSSEIRPVAVKELPLRSLVLSHLSESTPECGILMKYEDPEQFPAFYRDYARKFGILSVIAVDVCYRETSYARMAIHHCRHPKHWDEDDITLLRDISTHLGIALYQARLFQEAQIASREAEQANRRKSQALANMSHELRTPLNGVIGYADMLLSGYGDTEEKVQQYASNIAVSGRHLLDMINEILDVAKIESGKVELVPEYVEIQPFMDEISDIVRPLAAEKGITLHFDIQPCIGGGNWDPIRLRQILLNLLSNAIKYNRKGGEVFVRMHQTPDRQWLVGEVQDTGIGIPGDKLSDIFTEFFRVDAPSQTHPGTGLGLTLTKQLLELHGGSISVDSEEGIGSTFTFRLPLKVAETVGAAPRRKEFWE